MLTCVLRGSRQSDHIVQRHEAHPEGCSKAGGYQHEGQGEDCAHNVHRAVHHEDGQPHRSPRGRLFCWVTHYLPHNLSHATVLVGPDGHSQELQAARTLSEAEVCHAALCVGPDGQAKKLQATGTMFEAKVCHAAVLVDPDGHFRRLQSTQTDCYNKVCHAAALVVH